MKTGGATFRQHILANFPPEQVYPFIAIDSDLINSNLEIDYLRSLTASRLETLRVITGHFPFVATEMLGLDFVTMTILRDPVQRTVSYLKHCKRYHPRHRDQSLDEIYADQHTFRHFIHEFQTRMFSLTAEDRPRSCLDEIEIDEQRLELAKTNLHRVDVLGTTERHRDFLAEVQSRFGWDCSGRRDARVSNEPWAISDELRDRIAQDNTADCAFYEYASRLVAERSQPDRGDAAPPERAALIGRS